MSIEPISSDNTKQYPCEHCGKKGFDDEYPNISPITQKMLHIKWKCAKAKAARELKAKETVVIEPNKLNKETVETVSTVDTKAMLPPTPSSVPLDTERIKAIELKLNQLFDLYQKQAEVIPNQFDGDKLDEALDNEVIERTDKSFGAPKKIVFSADSLAIMSYINKKGVFGKEMTVDDFVNRCIVEFAKNRGWQVALLHVSDYDNQGD